MLSKFLNTLKPKEYSVQILKDSTSQSAVKRIKRTRTSAPFRKIAALTLVLALGGGALASVTAATAVTAKQAQANIIADMVCAKADAPNSGAFNGGSNVYGPLGGHAQYGMAKIGANTKPSQSAFLGITGTWGKGIGAPSDGKWLTAYEKYGMIYPVYDSWVPVFTDKEIEIKRVDATKATYAGADGKLYFKSDTYKLQAGASPLTTSDVGACLAFLPTVSASVANMISVIPRFVMAVSIELYGATSGTSMADEESVLHDIGVSIDSFITRPGGLKDTLFLPFLLPLLLIGAIFVGWQGIVKQSTIAAVQSTVWMIAAIALGTVFLAQPTLLSKYSDYAVGEVQGVINQSVLSSSLANDMCELWRDKEASPSKRIVRETKCTIWHSTIYTTWAAGQFGEGAAATGSSTVLTQDAGRRVLNTDEYTLWYGSEGSAWASSWPQFMVDRQATTRSVELTEVAWAQLSGADGSTVNTDWAGSIGMISSAILMFFGAGASSAVLLVYGFALLIYQLTMVMAVLMSPFFFLFGIVPGWGRRILMRYAEILVSLIVKRIITGLLLAFYLVFYNLVVGDAQVNMLILKILIIFALALFFIFHRNKFVSMFADTINFGGDKKIGLPGGKTAAVAAGVGVGLLGGGLIGGMIVGNKIRKNNKDTSGNIKDLQIEGGSPTADIKTPRGPNTGAGSPNTGAGGGANPVKVVGKTLNVIDDAKRVKKLANDFSKKSGRRSQSSQSPSEPDLGSSSEAPQGSQGAPNASSGGNPQGAPTAAPQGGSTSGPTASAGKASGQAATGGAGAPVAPHGAKLGAEGVKTAGKFAGSGGSAGAGASLAPVASTGAGAAGAATSGTAGIVSGGAAAAAGSGAAAAGGAAATGAGIAAGGAAAGGGAVVAGAAAGSVVPVVGTAIGAAAGAAAVALAAKKKKTGENNGGE